MIVKLYFCISEGGIDEEIFRQIDHDMKDKIFDNSECGFKNFFNRLEMWKNNNYIKNRK